MIISGLPFLVTPSHINVTARRRGFHLIIEEIVAAMPQMTTLTKGVCQFFAKGHKKFTLVNAIITVRSGGWLLWHG